MAGRTIRSRNGRISVVASPELAPTPISLSTLGPDVFDFVETRRTSSNFNLLESEIFYAPETIEALYPEDIVNTKLDKMPRNAKYSLHKLARDGDKNGILDIINSWRKDALADQFLKSKLDKKDKDGYTALHYAVRYGHGEIMQLLINYGADISIAGDNGTQPIHLAARHMKAIQRPILESESHEQALETIDITDGTQQDPILRKLLTYGASPNARDAYLQTPLHYAALKGNVDAVEILTNARGIDLEAEDKSKATPLHSGCSLGSVPVVKTLHLSGANFLRRDNEGLTPFHYAVMSGHLELLEIIIAQCERVTGAIDVSALITDRNHHDQTALHLAVISGYYEVCKLLLEKGSAVNGNSYGGVTPLHLAASNGNADIVRLLLSYAANIEAKTTQGDTALHKAASMGREDIVKLLISRGANVNVQNDDHCTPLMLAVQMDNKRIVQYFIDHCNARINVSDISERTAIFLAAYENSLESLQVLLNCVDSSKIIDAGDRYDNTPLHVAAMKGYFAIVRLLIEKGAKLDAVNDEEHTPVHLSAQSGHVRIVRQLLNKKPTMVSDEDAAGNTPLHLAADKGHEEVIDTLINFAAAVVVRNASLWTPLDCAAAKGHVNAARTLLERGSPVDPTDRANVTPLHLACKGGYVEMTKLLLENGADITLLNAEGKNCLDLAIDNGYKDTSLAILDHLDWQSAMRHRTTEGGRITTPMRRMIEKLPAVALTVFNKCIKVSKDVHGNGSNIITLYYEFLDDTYADWNLEAESLHLMENSNDYRIFLQLMSKQIKESRFEKQLDKKRNHPLAIMVKREQEKLLSHPLVKSLIAAKWRSFGRLIYYSKLSLFIVFLFFLTCYAVVSTSNFQPYSSNTTSNSSGECLDTSDELEKVFVCNGSSIVIFLAALQLLLEVIQMINRRLSYFKSAENLTELTVFIFAIVYVTGFTYNDVIGKFSSDSTHISIGSLVIFLAWINLLLFLRKFPKLGIYFVMFTDVLKTFSLFSATFSLFIVAFGLSFYLLLSQQMPFSTPGRSIMKTIVMMIGEFEFDSIFNGDFQPYRITWLIFLIFVVVMTIILMNLLVGLAVDDIKAVQDQAELKRMAMQVDLVLDVEKFIPRRFRHHKFFQNQIKEVRYVDKDSNWLHRIKPHPASLNAIEAAKSNSKDPIEAVEEHTKSLTETVNEMKSEINSIKSMVAELLLLDRDGANTTGTR